MQPKGTVIGINNIADTNYRANPHDLVEKYGDMVYKIAVVQTKNKHDAEDVFQEVFLRLMKYQDRLKSEEHAKFWLIRVTGTCSKKLITSAWNRKNVTLDDWNAVDNMFDQTQSDLLEALAKLPEEQRITIHLHYQMGYKTEEIAAILGVAPGSVKSRLSRGREALRQILGKELD